MKPANIDTSHQIDSFRGWVVVAASFAAMFTVFGVAYSFGAFFKPMAEEFGSSPGATSAVFSITAFVYFLLGSVSGVAVDRYGPRRVLVIGALTMGGGLVLTSQVHSLWVGYLTYGVGVGIGVACGYVPMVAIVSGWFERYRGAALGIAVSGIGLGTLTVAPAAAALISRHGWRTTYVLFGGVSTAVLLICATVAAAPPTASAAPMNRTQLLGIMRTRPFRLLYISILLLSLALFVPFVYLVPFAETRGIGTVAAAGLVGVIGGASILGRLVIGPVADRVGHLAAFRVCFLTIGASFLIWLFGSSYVALVLFAVALGVGYGGFVALGPAVVAGLFGTDGLGGLIGFAYTAAAFGSLVGAPLAGMLINASSYRVAITLLLLVGLSSWATLRAVRPVDSDASTPAKTTAL